MSSPPVDNIILLADCYKSCHYKIYPPGTTTLYAYFESRGGKFPYTVFFGLQYILKRWLCGPGFKPTQGAKNVYTTIGRECAQICTQLHDTGYRGVSSVESAALGGAAHMISFKSSDTIAGTSMLRKYYHLKTVAGFSTPSSEHSTIISWGRERELDSHRHMLHTYSEGDAGCVCDSYDIWKCLEDMWCGELRELVLERGRKGGCIYLRPDSGEPKTVVLKCLEILGSAYGTDINSKGYKTLPPYLRVIHADGINHKTLWGILEHLKSHGWSTENAYFGAGGALLQRIDRDTQQCAYKVSYVETDGQGRDVYKQPITDSIKTSKRGRLSLHCNDGVYTTMQGSKGHSPKDLLVTVFENGELLQDYTFPEIQERAEITPEDFDIIKFLEEDSD
nr:nicotinamide phosphoribosyltransferase-like [Cherax quadricarinatus]